MDRGEPMDIDARIEQFKRMAEADPENELGHFSLGKAYIDAERFEEAVKPLQRVLQLNPTFSKAYQLLGQAQIGLDQRSDAVATLKRGYEVAAERGDVMPKNEMAALLTELGEQPPAVGSAGQSATAQPAAAASSEKGFRCARCGRPHGKLAERPFKGALGEVVWANTCQDCWQEWIRMGTKVINEMGLQLADPRAQAVYDEYMKEFLQIES